MQINMMAEKKWEEKEGPGNGFRPKIIVIVITNFFCQLRKLLPAKQRRWKIANRLMSQLTLLAIVQVKEPPPLVRKTMMLMMTLCLGLCRGESESVEGLFIGSFQGPSLLWTGMGLIFASSQSDLTHTVDQSPFWLFQLPTAKCRVCTPLYSKFLHNPQM